MQVIRNLLGFCSLLALTIGQLSAADPSALQVDRAAKLQTLARQLIDELQAAKWDSVVANFDATMTRVFPADKVSESWQAALKQFGPLTQVGASRNEKVANYDVIFVTCSFERGDLDVKFAFDSADKVAGFFFVPSGHYRPPAYARPDEVVTREVTVGRGLLNLPGTLMLPKQASKDQRVAAVILVHGSGPQDRDETIGPNKPFLDLAHGLSARGYAVLRYEKRTKAHPLAMSLMAATLTVREETIDDVVAAVELLQSQAEIDPQRIVVLGHSLGGMLLPRIAERTKSVAGYIGMAPSARQFEDILLQQTEYLLADGAELTPEAIAQIDKLKEQIAHVKSKELTAQTPSAELPLGVPAAYWLDLRGYEPANDAKKIEKPILLLQGGRDYQVTDEDLKLWRAALGDRANCTIREYPKLNHLFIAGESASRPAEYLREGHVDAAVIEDIDSFLRSRIP